MHNIKKGILIVITIIVVVFMLCILQYAIYYYSNPLRDEVRFSTAGCLIFSFEDGDYELVPVEVEGENLQYIYHNRTNAAQGDIFVNGYSILGHERNHDAVGMGFFSEFDGSDYTCVSIADDEKLCKIIAMSKEWNTIVCGVDVTSNISKRVNPRENEQALLVFPADNIETAHVLVDEVATNSEQMKEWLTKYKWIW